MTRRQRFRSRTPRRSCDLRGVFPCAARPKPRQRPGRSHGNVGTRKRPGRKRLFLRYVKPPARIELGPDLPVLPVDGKHEQVVPTPSGGFDRQQYFYLRKLIRIPQEILDYYRMYRPSPLIRAYNLEKKLGTPAKIYYKFEGNNTSGSHKLNSAIAQAYYAKKQGLKGVTTETGAGQWGTALSMACAYLGLDLKVFMVKCSYEQKPLRREVMRTYGASVTPSPSNTTNIGRAILAKDPDTTGSLGCAISEAVEVATTTPGYRYVLGSVLNQVLLHQSAFHAVGRIAEFPGIAIKVSDRGVAAAHGPAASRTVQLFIEQVRRCCHFSLFQMVDTPPRLLKLVFGDNGLKTVGNDDPVLPFCFPALLAADPKIGAHTADGLAGVSFLIENGQHHKIVPKTILHICGVFTGD